MRIGVIGAGKVGVSISYIMLQKGLHVIAMSDKDSHALEIAIKYLEDKGDVIFTSDNTHVVDKSDMVIIATQDRIINEVAQELDGKIYNFDGKYIVHTSGAHSSQILKPLDSKGARLGVMHPLQTFPDIESAIMVLPDTYIFIQGDVQCLPALRYVAEIIGKKSIEIKENHMVLYHLSAVIVCNLFCALLYSGEDIAKEIGIGLEPYFPIIRATLKNIEQKGPLKSLTGPIVRGDINTIEFHLDSLKDKGILRDLYITLSRVALKMAQERGDINKELGEKISHLLEQRGEP